MTVPDEYYRPPDCKCAHGQREHHVTEETKNVTYCYRLSCGCETYRPQEVSVSASRKTLTDKIRKKAIDLHRKNGCTDDEPCSGPTKAELEQATAAVMHNQEADAS